MKKILVMIDWFEPAYKAGGPIRTISNMVKLLQDEYDISVFAGDRDLGEKHSIPGINLNKWLRFDRNIKVYYASSKQLTWKNISGMINSMKPDFIYCSGIYSRYSSIYPVLMKRFGIIKSKIILSPHGMLRPSALSYKPFKKKVFLKIYKYLNFPKDIHFHATDDSEVQDIAHQLGNVAISSVFDAPAPMPTGLQSIPKTPGELSIIFVGRIHPVKNLSLLLSALKFVMGRVKLTVIGTNEDHDYWDNCKQLIEILPGNISVSYIGEVRHEEIQSLIYAHHIFSLPTKGENFGHSIYEALACGRPVLISDQTPWRNLTENKAGWDISNSNISEYSRAIEDAASWTEEVYGEWVKGARTYVEQKINFGKIFEQYNKLFS